MGMSDGAPSLAAIGMIEYGYFLEFKARGGTVQIQARFLMQFPKRTFQEPLLGLQEASRDGPQVLPRVAASAHQQDVSAGLHHGIQRDEGAPAPDLLALLDGQMFFPHLRIFR